MSYAAAQLAARQLSALYSPVGGVWYAADQEMQCEETLKTLVACLFACAVWAHSPELFAQAAAVGPAPKAAAPATSAVPVAAPPQAAVPAGDVVAPEPDALDADAAEAEAAAAMSEKHDVGASRLESDLRKIEAEREEYSRFWPWFTLTTGAALTAGSVAVGAGHVFGCDGGCSTSAWIGILVAAGTFVATVGTIWVVNSNLGLAEIDSRRYHLQQELERIRVSANLPNKSDYQTGSSLLTMKFALR